MWGSVSEALNEQTVEGDPNVAVPATDDGSLIIDRRHCTPMLATARLTDEPDVTHASERLLNETPILSSVRIEHAAFASFDDASSVDARGGFPKAVNDVEPIPVEPAKGAFPSCHASRAPPRT